MADVIRAIITASFAFIGLSLMLAVEEQDHGGYKIMAYWLGAAMIILAIAIGIERFI